VNRTALALAALAVATPRAASAGETACWFEQGVLVAPAVVAGIAGDFILDTGAAATVIHETRAQSAGIADVALRGEVRLAGVRLSDQALRVEDLDARAWRFPTPIAGVLGADVLGGHVLDVDFAPCRLRLLPAGRRDGFAARRRLPMLGPAGGPPIVRAGASDGPQATLGRFVVATGADAPVRLSTALAAVDGVAEASEVLPYGDLRPRLRALSLAGELSEFTPAGLIAAESLPRDTLGVIGAPLLTRYRVRFDFSRRQILLGEP
jgi:hypothetical protein